MSDRLHVGVPEVNPSVRGEPRRDGFAKNWSRFGQAALDLQWRDILPPGLAPHLDTIEPIWAQVEGLSQQIADGEIDVAIVYLGHNDVFLRWATGGSFDDEAFVQFSGALVARIGEVVDTLLQAGDAKVIVSLNSLTGPVVAGTTNPALQLQAEIVGPAVAAHNVALAAAMSARGVPVTDLFGFLESGRFDEETRTLSVGGYEISVDSVAEVTDLLPAGHPQATGPCQLLLTGPWWGGRRRAVVHGLMANEFVAAIFDAFGFAIAALSDEEILAAAGLVPVVAPPVETP